MFDFFKPKRVHKVEYDRKKDEYSRFLKMDVKTAMEVHSHWLACLYGCQTLTGAAKILNISNPDRFHRIAFSALKKLIKEGLTGVDNPPDQVSCPGWLKGLKDINCNKYG